MKIVEFMPTWNCCALPWYYSRRRQLFSGTINLLK